MYRILLVDDEILVRDAIRENSYKYWRNSA